MRSFGTGQLGPLGEPEVGVFADDAAGHGEFLGVGDGVQPDGACAEEAAEAEGEVAAGGAGGEDDIRALADEDEEEACGHFHEAELVPAVGVVDDVEAVVGDVDLVAAIDGDEDDFVAIEGGDDADEFGPVSAAAGDQECLGPGYAFGAGLFSGGVWSRSATLAATASQLLPETAFRRRCTSSGSCSCSAWVMHVRNSSWEGAW